ncbi:hypothetical protein DUNSADRAFT_4127 [Dunaliella salina]|uniref:Uncharacterized protein n=1 Tax=Dunaliella salina TaxID=3046 RepID=A0ABQ7GSN2_DUNSA|nr:hypothetical protein DUNSADRAFT_4127 [Dunaliella salina]|eukprot:KAF5837624.1 hypothetical protein DUNSADRAFT_4127 [Dunaliella salina]
MGVYPLIPSAASLLPRIPAQPAAHQKPTPASSAHSKFTLDAAPSPHSTLSSEAASSPRFSTSTPASSADSTFTSNAASSPLFSTSTPASSAHSTCDTPEAACQASGTGGAAALQPSGVDRAAVQQPLDADRAAVLQFRQLVSAMQDQKAEAGVDLISARQREKGVAPEIGQQEQASSRRGVDHLRQMQLIEFWSRLPSEPLPVLGQVPGLGAAGDDQVLLF